MQPLFTPGSRVVVRDAEWRIKRIDESSDGGQALACEGLSELVLGKDATFLTKLEDNIEVLAPEGAELVPYLQLLVNECSCDKIRLDRRITIASVTTKRILQC